MSIRTWMFLALLAITLLGVGGIGAAHAQEFHGCPMPQTELGLPPEIEQYQDSLEGFQGCPVPRPEGEDLPAETNEQHDSLQLPIYCLMPQTEQYHEPPFSENNGEDWRSRYFVNPCAVCDVTTDGPGTPCVGDCLGEDYVIRDYLGDQFTDDPPPYVGRWCCPQDIFLGPRGYTYCNSAE
jgi:hypothetical protein